MNKLMIACLFMLGLIHILPVSGVLGADKLELLYGTQVSDTNMEILLRHRAVLFAIIGGILWASIVFPSLRSTALLVAFVSVISFVVIVATSGQCSPQIIRVMKVDVLAFVLIIAALCCLLFTKTQSMTTAY